MASRYNSPIPFPTALLAVIGFGLLASFVDLPPSYFSLKHNILNTYFIKLGWAWTVSLLTIWHFSAQDWDFEKIKRNLRAKFVLLCWATIFWYCLTHVFDEINLRTGKCSDDSIASPRLCVRHKGVWNGLDFSGHCFFLLFSSLLFWEETRRFPQSNPFVGGAVYALRGIWLIGLFTTLCYPFHTRTDKVAGLLFGLLSWALLYHTKLIEKTRLIYYGAQKK